LFTLEKVRQTETIFPGFYMDKITGFKEVYNWKHKTYINQVEMVNAVHPK
jgi:hypothetical protein